MRQVKILQLRSKILPVIRQGITTDDKGKLIKIKSQSELPQNSTQFNFFIRKINQHGLNKTTEISRFTAQDKSIEE